MDGSAVEDTGPHINPKLESLSKIRSELDPGMYEILKRFNELPFRSIESSSGHIDPHTGKQTKNAGIWFETDHSTDEEEDISKRFLSELNRLNEAVAKRLKTEKGNYFSLQGYLVEKDDDEIEKLSVEESMREGLPIGLVVDVSNEVREKHSAREVLSTVWKEFWNYMNTFDHKDLPAPNFKNGDVFVKNSK